MTRKFMEFEMGTMLYRDGHIWIVDKISLGNDKNCYEICYNFYDKNMTPEDKMYMVRSHSDSKTELTLLINKLVQDYYVLNTVIIFA